MDEVSIFLTVDEANAVRTVLGLCFLGFDMKDHDTYYALHNALRDVDGITSFKNNNQTLYPPEHTPKTPQDDAAAIIATIDRVYSDGGSITNGSTVIIRGIDFGDITTSNSSIVRDIKA